MTFLQVPHTKILLAPWIFYRFPKFRMFWKGMTMEIRSFLESFPVRATEGEVRQYFGPTPKKHQLWAHSLKIFLYSLVFFWSIENVCFFGISGNDRLVAPHASTQLLDGPNMIMRHYELDIDSAWSSGAAHAPLKSVDVFVHHHNSM